MVKRYYLRRIVVLLCCGFSLKSFSQPVFEWAQKIGGNNSEWTECIAADNFCNVYVEGNSNSPNFTAGNVTFSTSNAGGFGDFDTPITVYDIAGRQISTIESGAQSIDVSTLANGIYVLMAPDANVKFIKE